MRKLTSIAVLLGILASVSLTGCQLKKSFPFYSMEKREDRTEVLSVDGVQYVRKPGWDENAHYDTGDNPYVWAPVEGIGEQIGVCGDEDTQYAALNLYEVAGDEEHIFLYTWPAHFYFGGRETRLWMREGVTIEPPTIETVSSVTVVPKEGENTVQVNDPAMIAALLETYSGDSVSVPRSEDWIYGSLMLHHREFPFLQYEIEYRCSPELKISYCQNETRLEWIPLSAEWFTVLSGLSS